MSWSLTLDREQRNHSRPTSYNEKHKWKEILNEDDQNLSVKKKRGRPKTNVTDVPTDGTSSNPPPKKRGRPPKSSRPPTPSSTEIITNADSTSRKPKIKQPLKNHSESNSSSSMKSMSESEDDYYYADYLYEYEYEYSESEDQRAAPSSSAPNTPITTPVQNTSTSTKTSPSKSTLLSSKNLQNLAQQASSPTQTNLSQMTPSLKSSLPKRPTNQKLKQKPISDPSIIKEDAEMYTVQEIVGQKDPFVPPKNPITHYFVKFANRAYIHCRWLSRVSLAKFEGGELALKKYLQKLENCNNQLIHSLSIPSLLIFKESDISTQWFEVDRVFCENKSPTSSSSGLNSGGFDANKPIEYFVKWSEMEYEFSTYEKLEDFQNTSAVQTYMSRKAHMNPRKIPSRWVRPTLTQLTTVNEKPISKHGDIFRDFQIDGLNWLIRCWFEHRFSILGDETRIGKMPQLIRMLCFLSSEFGINGPFLVLASPNQIQIWKQQFEIWSEFNVVVFAGIASSRQLTIEHEMEVADDHGRILPDFIKCDVILTTYDLFLNFNQHFVDIEWRYIIADDGYKMRNSRGRIRNLIKQLNFEHITLMMEWEMMKQNNIYKIYFLMNFIDPKNFGNFTEFVDTYQPYEGKKVEELKKVVEPYLLSRDAQMIEDVMEGKEETLILVEPSVLQKRLYREAVKKKTEILMKPITDEADAPLLELIEILRQLINHPLFCPSIKEELAETNYEDMLIQSCGKMHFVNQILPQLVSSGQKVMIFSQFVRVLDLLEEYVKSKEFEFERIDAMTPADERVTIVKRFDESSTPVFLFHSKPGSYQIDLNLFDTVIVYDNDSYFFHSEMKGTLYRIVTNGSYEMNRAGRNATNTCFDGSPLQYCAHGEFRAMDAEDIELMLRDSIRPMFDQNDEPIKKYFSKSLNSILTTCVRKEVANNEAILDLAKQKQFWNELLQPPPRQKKAQAAVATDSVTRVKQLINIMIDHGFCEDEDQLDLLKCAVTLAPPENENTLSYLNKIVGDNSSDRPVRRFGNSAFLIDKLAPKLFENVVFFARLHRALHFAAKPEVIWPSIQPLWKDVYSEYSLMYHLDKSGFKQLPTSFESAKSFKPKQIEKRIMSIVEGIEEQFAVSGGFYAEGKPIDPQMWKNIHPNIVMRMILADDEVVNIYRTINDFGIPLLPNHKPNINKIASTANLSQVSINVTEECINDIVGLALSIRNDNSTQDYSRFPTAAALKGKVTNQDLREIVVICRHMEKIYSFLQQYDIEKAEVFNAAKLPEGYTLEDIRLYLRCIYKYGPRNTEKWQMDNLIEFPNDLSDRLKLATVVIDQIRGPNIVTASSHLKIYNFGRIIDAPNFRSRHCPYPIGFYSARLLVRDIEGLPQTWYRCEIQAVGSNPVFVVAPLDEPSNEFIDETPIDAWKTLLASYIGNKEAAEKIRHAKISGEWLFGLVHPNVLETLHQNTIKAGYKVTTEYSPSDSDDVEYKPNS